MKRISVGARPDWREKAESAGFDFHSIHGEPYWDEADAYAFTLEEVEDGIEDPATALHALCREAVAQIVVSEELMTRLGIPAEHMDLVAGSWTAGEPELYGRMDLAFGSGGPAKLLEYNADTPTSLFESASFQWDWLEDMLAAGRLPAGADQFNGLFEALGVRLADLFATGTDLHFAAFRESPEDYATVETMAYAAREAGLGAHFVNLPDISISTEGQFLDGEDRVIGALFKLYPWEDMLRDDFADAIQGARCRILEPAWKAVVSNKGILPVLWRMFEGHPNLLPAFFEDELAAGDPVVERARAALDRGCVRKPIFSREGAGVTITEGGRVTEASANAAYAAHPHVVQAYEPLPLLDGMRPVVGAWIVGERCVGMGLREDRSRITEDLSRFKPHYIEP